MQPLLESLPLGTLLRKVAPLLAALLLLAATLGARPVQAEVQIASGHEARCVIVTQPGATAPERHAAEELAAVLKEMTGASFAIQEQTEQSPASAIIVGPGPLATKFFPQVDLSTFGPEEYTIRTQEGRLLLAGGRPRGTLYAVYRFLQDQLGVRWYTPWCTHIPPRESLSLASLDVRGKPAFEYRDPFWFPAFDGDWAARNGSNSQSARLTEKHGGQMTYKGFVHTFYPLVPPAEHFQKHPEWYSLVHGKRVGENAQLCASNPELRDFIVAQVKKWLRESPGVNIVSVSQNDYSGACECPQCAAIDEREGSPAGSILELVNYVAEKIEPEFPNVTVDTLAYQHTRKAPQSLRPRRNVVIRLCSGECDFSKPLDAPNNALFARDICDWQRLTQRLYIWDYTTDFCGYLMPLPNWYVLGPNVRFFRDHGVVGLFEQGAYQSSGGEMSELKAWLLAQMLWNPDQDDRKLVREFLEAYYGVASARYILEYFELMGQAAQPHYIGIGHPAASPYIGFPTLVRAERLWQEAEAAARGNPEHLWRVRKARLSLGYLWIWQWVRLRRECCELGQTWPLDESRRAYAARWLATVNEAGPAGWTPMTVLLEGGDTAAEFVAGLEPDPDPSVYEALPRHAARSAPLGVSTQDAARGLSLQDDRAYLVHEPECAQLLSDPKASDGVAVRLSVDASATRGMLMMYGSQLPPEFRPGRYQVYFVIRVEAADGAPADAGAFQMRIVNAMSDVAGVDRFIKIGETSNDYRAYLAGTVELQPSAWFWLFHSRNKAAKAVWFDRLFLVPVP